MHDTDVLLRRAHVAGVLERDPRMPGFEQHRQHLAPKVLRPYALEQAQLAGAGQFLIFPIAALERTPVQVVQVGAVAGREQRPFAILEHALHEQVGDPVRRVHVVRASAIVARVLAQLEELFDVEVPRFQVGADRALALAALVYRHGRVVDHLEERHHALRLAVGTLDVGAKRAHGRPVIAEAAGPFGQHRVVLDGAVDRLEIVGHGGQEARGQLRTKRARIEQRGRRSHVVERAQQVVELDGAAGRVVFLRRQAHRHAHEEHLGQLEAHIVTVDEVAVVQRLQAQIGEILVAFWLQCGAECRQVEPRKRRGEQFQFDTLGHERGQRRGVDRPHFRLGRVIVLAGVDA